MTGAPQDAARELRILARSGGASVATERRTLLEGLTATAAQSRPGAPDAPDESLCGRVRSSGPQPTEARRSDAGTGPLERFAAPFLNGAGDPVTTPRVLHALVLVAMEDKAWPEVATLTTRLLDRFPGYAPAPELLSRVAGEAAAEQQWPIVRTGYAYAIARSGSARPGAARPGRLRRGAVPDGRRDPGPRRAHPRRGRRLPGSGQWPARCISWPGCTRRWTSPARR